MSQTDATLAPCLRPEPPARALRLARLLLSAWVLLLPLALDAQDAPGSGAEDSPPIPVPDLSALEAPVASQIEGTREALRQVLAEPTAPVTEKAEAYGDLGRLYHAYHLSEAAAACYLNAGRLSSKDYRWAYLLAYLHQGSGSLEEAVRYYRLALELNPGNVPALTRLGDAYLELNRPAQAEEVLLQAIGSAPGNVAATALLGQVALSRQDYRRAVDYLEQALAQAPGASRLHYPLGQAYRNLGDMDRAREHLAQRGEVGVRPVDPLVDEMEQLREGERIHLLRGRMAFRARAYAQAADAFRKAVEARPDSARARVNLGTALAAAGDVSGAIEQFLATLGSDPTNATAHFNLGVLFAGQGKIEEARQHLEQTVRLQPEDGQARFQLAEVLRRRGKNEEALTQYDAAVGPEPADPRIRVRLVSLLIELGRFDEAGQRLAEAYGFLPREPLIASAYARFLAGCPKLSLRDGAQAVELATTLYELQPTVANAGTLAMAYAEVGRCQEAAELQGRAANTSEAAGEKELTTELRALEAHYRSGPPCRLPGSP